MYTFAGIMAVDLWGYKKNAAFQNEFGRQRLSVMWVTPYYIYSMEDDRAL